MSTLGSCVALQSRIAVVPLMTRLSAGGTEMTVRPAKNQREIQRRGETWRERKRKEVTKRDSTVNLSLILT